MGEILFASIESDRHSPVEVRTVADSLVRRRLLAVPGVAQVTVTGGARKQYEVVVTPGVLAAHRLTVGEVATALNANRNTSAGFRVDGGQEYLIRGIGRLDDPERHRRHRRGDTRHPTGLCPGRSHCTGW